MKKVLYISYDGLTDPLGQSQVLPYVSGLSKLGYHFTILSFEKKLRLQKEGKIIKEITESSGINWVPLTFTEKPPVLSKIYDRYRMTQAAIRLYKKNHFDIIHCRSYVASEVGLKLKEKFGVPFIFDMRGFWADEKIDNGQWNLNNPLFGAIYRHYKKKEKEFLLHADGIVSLTQNAKDHLLGQPGFGHLNINVIPCCADLNHFNYTAVSEESSLALRKTLGIADHARVITYLGSVGGWYLTDHMFAFFKDVLKSYPDFVMLLLTKDDPEKVKKEAVDYGIPSEKIIIIYSSRQELPLYLSISYCSIFFIKNTFSKKASSPTKHAELMGMGIPVICNDIGDTGRIVKKTSTGVLITSFEADELKKAVMLIPELNKIDKHYIRKCASEYFDLEYGIHKYLSLYNILLKKESPAQPTT